MLTLNEMKPKKLLKMFNIDLLLILIYIAKYKKTKIPPSLKYFLICAFIFGQRLLLKVHLAECVFQKCPQQYFWTLNVF